MKGRLWCLWHHRRPPCGREGRQHWLCIDNIMGGDAKTRSGAVLDDSRFVRKLGVVRIPDGKTY